MEKFKWQHIQFADGSNPHICKTQEAFDFMKTNYDLKQIKYGMWLAKNKSPNCRRCEYGKIIYANACYTGGGIYIYYGNLSDGTFFRTWTDGECIEIVDVNASIENEEADYEEFYEKHRVGTLINEEYASFWNEMLQFIIDWQPKGNYWVSELEEEFLPLF